MMKNQQEIATPKNATFEEAEVQKETTLARKEKKRSIFARLFFSGVITSDLKHTKKIVYIASIAAFLSIANMFEIKFADVQFSLTIAISALAGVVLGGVFGAVAAFLVARILPRRSIVLQFVAFAVVGGAVEYFTSLFQERTFGSVSWDYSAHTLNLGGRVSGQMALIWGFLGMLFVGLLYPTLRRLLHRMHTLRWQVFCVACSVFMALNLAISASAIFRWRERAEAIPPSNKWEMYLDATYPDSLMEHVYCDMRFR